MIEARPTPLLSATMEGTLERLFESLSKIKLQYVFTRIRLLSGAGTHTEFTVS